MLVAEDLACVLLRVMVHRTMRAEESNPKKREELMSKEKNEGFANSDGVGGAARSDALESDGGEKFPNARGEKETNEMIEPSEVGLSEMQEKKLHKSLHWKVEFILLCFMLLIAIVGMAFTQASVDGAWEYWLFAVLVFAAIGTFRDFKWARQAHKPVWKSMVKQVVHWSVLLVIMKALFWMERYNAISREASSIAAILLLALTSIHAGLHFHWTFAIVGVVLAGMGVVLGVLEQSMLLSWMVILPLVFGGAILFFLKARRAAHHD